MSLPNNTLMAQSFREYASAIVVHPILEILIPAFLYGVYSILYGICIKILKKARTQYHLHYIAIMTALFVVATAGLVLNVATVLNAGYHNLSRVLDYGYIDYAACSGAMRAFDYVFVSLSMFADAVLISRCYIVWGRQLVVIIIPTILCLGCGAAGFATVASAQLITVTAPGEYPSTPVPARIGSGLHQSFILAEVIINLLLTFMIAGRIFFVTRRLPTPLCSEVKRKYRSVMAIIIESGMMYPVNLILLLFLDSSIGDLVGYISFQIMGIAPTLLIVRVGLGLGSVVEDVESCIELQSNHDRITATPGAPPPPPPPDLVLEINNENNHRSSVIDIRRASSS